MFATSRGGGAGDARADFGFELKGGAKISGGVQIFGTFHPLSGALF